MFLYMCDTTVNLSVPDFSLKLNKNQLINFKKSVSDETKQFYNSTTQSSPSVVVSILIVLLPFNI